jgi:hypothetical protein
VAAQFEEGRHVRPGSPDEAANDGFSFNSGGSPIDQSRYEVEGGEVGLMTAREGGGGGEFGR